MFAFLLFLAALAPPQDDVFRADTRLVVLHVTVVDKNGRFVMNLPQSAFRAYEDGVEQPLKIFKREDVPVSMGIVIDNSASMGNKRTKVEAAAIALVKASNRQDEVFIVNFNDEVFRDVDFTSDMSKLQAGVARIDCRGGTAMRDAIARSIDYERTKAHHDKKVLVVVTDGNDNMSEVTLDALIQQAQRQEILIYVIGLLSEEEHKEAREARRAIDMIVKATGGQAWYPGTVDEVGQIAVQVAHDIRSQYILAYTPLKSVMDGSFRQIKVTAQGPGHPVARTRTGYYATEKVRKAAASTGQ